MLHDVELLGRCLAESIETKLGEFGLSWDKARDGPGWSKFGLCLARPGRKVVILGFGKGAGIALYASLLNIFAQQARRVVESLAGFASHQSSC